MTQVQDKDACELLDTDHLAVKHLFVEYARRAYAPTADAVNDAGTNGDRITLATSICEALTVHAQIEEEIFYPALRSAVPAAAALLDLAATDHQQAKQLIARIRELDSADAELDQCVADLARAVEDHVMEERLQLFPKARAAPSLDLVALGAQLRERQQALDAGEPGA